MNNHSILYIVFFFRSMRVTEFPVHTMILPLLISLPLIEAHMSVLFCMLLLSFEQTTCNTAKKVHFFLSL